MQLRNLILTIYIEATNSKNKKTLTITTLGDILIGNLFYYFIIKEEKNEKDFSPTAQRYLDEQPCRWLWNHRRRL